MTALALALAFTALLAWDAWRRYLAALDRTAGLKQLEKALSERITKLETTQSQHTRALGVRAMAQARAVEQG